MRMNSFQGKQILALIRGGDYAHPGEATAIELVFAGIPKNSDQKLLDVGCGRGGTANYLQTQAWGKVTGLDIDADCIAYAQAEYPACGFHCGDVVDAAEILADWFDLIYLFNSFYAFPNPAQALNALRQVAHSQTRLIIFDYTRKGNTQLNQPTNGTAPFIPNPIDLEHFPKTLADSGWQLTHIQDLSEQYVAWYQAFLQRAEDQQQAIIELAGVGAWEMVMLVYQALLTELQAGRLGGALILAQAKES